jgi:hypothetical protein
MKKAVLLILINLVVVSGVFSQKRQKYAISMFHFNLQYVAGDYKIENRILKESFYPALKFFEKHPYIKADFEIQGYGIEVLAEEYPQMFKLFKKLINRGQIELVIAHYSDQFFIAYPALDLQKSIEISDQILKKYGLKRSRVFFGQEIQWTPAYPYVLKGEYDLVVNSSDPHSYYRGETEPLVRVKYGEDEILYLTGAGKKNLKNLDWTFAFLDDGEVFNSLDYRSDFYRVPEQEKKSIDKYMKLKKEGYKFVTMSELANIMKNDPDYTIPDYPFVPEGTWNMSVCGPFMWMGRQRSGVETDGITRALSYEVRGKVLAAEELVKKAKAEGQNTAELDSMLHDAWIHLLLSEVSDASGWTPWLIEVQYTANEVAKVETLLGKIFKGLKNNVLADGKTLFVNTGTHEIKEVSEVPEVNLEDSYLPIQFSVRADSYTAKVKRVQDGLFRLDIEALRPEDGGVEISFNTAEDGLWYSAGAGEEIAVEIPTDLKHDPAFTLSNGFINLGTGYNLIKDCSVEHIAATWRQKEKKLVFREELNPKNPKMNMRFYILKGSVDQGLKFGNALNTWPSYYISYKDDKLSFRQHIPEL